MDNFLDHMIFVCFSAVGVGLVLGIFAVIFNGIFYIIEKMGFGNKYDIIYKLFDSKGCED